MAESHDNTSGEIWKTIPGHRGFFQVSNLGRVRSLPRVTSRGRRFPGEIKKLTPIDSGHLVVSVNEPKRNYLVHRLVLEAFVGPCPEGLEGCHFPDRDPTNNRLENLRWGTRSDNVGDAIVHDTATINENNGNAILTNEKVREIKRLLPLKSNSELGRMYGVARQTINSIRRGDSWRGV